MNDWEKITSKIIKTITDMEVENERQQIIKVAIAVNLYQMLYSEEVFNDTMNKLRRR